MNMDTNATAMNLVSLLNTTTNSTNQSQSTAHVNSDVTKYCASIILAVGCIGNLLSFGVMRTKELRSKSVSVYLATLAVLDTAVLVMFYNKHVIRGVYKMRVPGPCNVITWLYFSVLTASPWVVIGVTVDRVIAVYAPLKSRLILAPKRAAVIVLVILLIVFGIYTPVLFAFDKDTCKPTTLRSFVVGLHGANAMTYSVLPIILLFILNTAIIVQLRRHTMVSAQSNKHVHKVTVMVVTVSLAYVCLTLPNAIYMTLSFAGVARNALASELCRLVFMANHAANFFLYVLTSANFRQVLSGCVARCCYRRRNDPEVASETTMTTITGSESQIKQSVQTLKDDD